MGAAGLMRLAPLPDGSNGRLLRLGELAVELLAKLPHLLRRQGLDAAQEVVEIAMRHRDQMWYSVMHLRPSLPRPAVLAKASGLTPQR